MPPPRTGLWLPAVPSLPAGDKQPLVPCKENIPLWGHGLSCVSPLCRGKIPEQRRLQWLSPCSWALQHSPDGCSQNCPHVRQTSIFPIPCYSPSNPQQLNQISLLCGYFVTFGLILFILLSPSQWSIFYKFCLFFFFPCYPRIFNFCPIPASLAKINTPAAWKLWIRLFCVHSCHPWATIHLLSYLCVSSFRIISFIF